jgi:hypothetical protein
VTEDLRARIQAIEEEVARDNQAIWDEMKK